MIPTQSNNASPVEPSAVLPSGSAPTEVPALALWLAETMVVLGADGSLCLLLALDMETCNVLAWEVRRESSMLADIVGVFAGACEEAGAPFGSKVRVASEFEHAGQMLYSALRSSPDTLPFAVEPTAGEGRRMHSAVADITALVDAALKFELAQAGIDDGPLSIVAIQHLVAQIFYWHRRRFNLRAGSQPWLGR